MRTDMVDSGTRGKGRGKCRKCYDQRQPVTHIYIIAYARERTHYSERFIEMDIRTKGLENVLFYLL